MVKTGKKPRKISAGRPKKEETIRVAVALPEPEAWRAIASTWAQVMKSPLEDAMVMRFGAIPAMNKEEARARKDKPIPILPQTCVVMPVGVAVQFHRALGQQLALLQDDGAGKRR